MPALYELAGDVVSVFGRADTKDASYLSILAESEIDTEFTKEELSAADEAAAEVISNSNRSEKRQLIFTFARFKIFFKLLNKSRYPRPVLSFVGYFSPMIYDKSRI